MTMESQEKGCRIYFVCFTKNKVGFQIKTKSLKKNCKYFYIRSHDNCLKIVQIFK
jgi:hypothetical protein